MPSSAATTHKTLKNYLETKAKVTRMALALALFITAIFAIMQCTNQAWKIEEDAVWCPKTSVAITSLLHGGNGNAKGCQNNRVGQKNQACSDTSLMYNSSTVFWFWDLLLCIYVFCAMYFHTYKNHNWKEVQGYSGKWRVTHLSNQSKKEKWHLSHLL